MLFALYQSTLTKEIRSIVIREVRTVEFADDKIMASTERHKKRHVGDPLRVKALGTTPKVRAGKACRNECWQQDPGRRHQIDKNTGELKNTFDYTALTVTEDTADIVFSHHDPHNSIPSEAATDFKADAGRQS